LETYKKPVVVEEHSVRNIAPAVGAAFVAGVAAGLARGKNVIDSKHTQSLKPRKNFNE